MAPKGHVPVRTCVVCGIKRSKRELCRLVLDPRGVATPDREQRLPGRGAYACRECVPGVRLTKRVQRAFRNQVKEISEQVSGQLSTQ